MPAACEPLPTVQGRWWQPVMSIRCRSQASAIAYNMRGRRRSTGHAVAESAGNTRSICRVPARMAMRCAGRRPPAACLLPLERPTARNPIAGADGGANAVYRDGRHAPIRGETRAERIATADPRPSIEEQPSHVGTPMWWWSRLATARLVDERLLLPEDAAEAIAAAAEAGTLARLAP